MLVRCHIQLKSLALVDLVIPYDLSKQLRLPLSDVWRWANNVESSTSVPLK